jgi:glycosyltransferase involved in cell wall biosynthesis
MNIIFSIITPCYKGKNFLPRVYSSLARQGAEFAFEWIIVDDFSNDNGETRAVIEKLQQESTFPIQAFYLKENFYGSQSTYTGATHAKGEYTIILDQDDMLADNALEIFSTYISAYESSPNFAGVCGRCIRPSGEVIGTPTRWQEKLSNELEIRHIDKVRGEMFQCTKTKLVAEYFYGMKPGYTNGWAWSRIAKQYQFLYTNKIVRLYDTENPESTSNLKKLIYLDAQFEQSSEYIVGNANYLLSDKLAGIRMLIQWARVGLHLNKSYAELLKMVPSNIKALFFPAFVVSYIKVRRDRMIGSI